MLKVGDPVTYVDSLAKERPALVTAVWGNFDNGNVPAINIVIINLDENQSDSYGRKIERWTSVVHQSRQPAHGNYWK